MEKLKFNLKAISTMALGLIVFIGCDSDDDDMQEPVAETIVLDCTNITEATVLKNRGSGIDYIWPCHIRVEAPLTIEPGVTIAFEQGAGMEVLDYGTRTGSITAIGTKNKPIVFTGTTKTAGSWGRIYMNSGNLNNKLHHCIIEYGGDTDGKLVPLTVVDKSKVEIQNTIVRNSKGNGVFVQTYGNIEGWKANTITQNQGYPIQIAARKVKFLDGTQSTYSNNGIDQIYVNSESIYERGFIEDEVNGPKHVWLDPGIPYFVDESLFVIIDRKNQKPGHLQIREGCQIIFGQEFGIQLQRVNTIIEVLGTVNNPVNFSGQYGAGSWKGIHIIESSSNLNTIKNTTIADAGQSGWDWFKTGGGAISLGQRLKRAISLSLINVHITNSAGAGIIEKNLLKKDISYDKVTFENISLRDYVVETD